ncbi:SRPBCC domain-containing protein [Streptomyces sp. NPDC005507]|uniref:SRPBCC domain-containing protein n=1 Tax=Streptomyces sp. NPDC005507 TaxID=3154885 RepID=UPI0033A11A08
MHATPRQIWGAWTDPGRVAKWWGPAGFRSTVHELDVHAGGLLDITMHSPDGTNYPNVYRFDDIVPFERLDYTNLGSKEFGLAAFRSVMDLIPVDARRTRVVLEAQFDSAEDKRRHVEDFGAVEGSRQLLERLEEQAGLGVDRCPLRVDTRASRCLRDGPYRVRRPAVLGQRSPSRPGHGQRPAVGTPAHGRCRTPPGSTPPTRCSRAAPRPARHVRHGPGRRAPRPCAGPLPSPRAAPASSRGPARHSTSSSAPTDRTRAHGSMRKQQKGPARGERVPGPSMRQARLPVMPRATWPHVFQEPTTPDVSSQFTAPSSPRSSAGAAQDSGTQPRKMWPAAPSAKQCSAAADHGAVHPRGTPPSIRAARFGTHNGREAAVAARVCQRVCGPEVVECFAKGFDGAYRVDDVPEDAVWIHGPP